MSDSEQDASVLGKRARNGPENDTAEDADMDPPSAAQEDDESDDDVGPMPMPEGATSNAATKKKRKGTSGIYAHWSGSDQGPHHHSSPP
jgi:peptidylprolyl isomerase domain and WD repeat-containing protein 1